MYTKREEGELAFIALVAEGHAVTDGGDNTNDNKKRVS
jgi:hypothetical protein